MVQVEEAQRIGRDLSGENRKPFTLGGSVRLRVDYSSGIPPLSKLFKPNGVNMSDCRLVPKVETPDNGVREITASFLGFARSVTPSVLEFQTVCFQYEPLAIQEHLALVWFFREQRQQMVETLSRLYPDKVNGKVCFASSGTILEHRGSGVNYIPCSVNPTMENNPEGGAFVAYPQAEKVMFPSSWIFLVKQRVGRFSQS
jgi:hypothetical protein